MISVENPMAVKASAVMYVPYPHMIPACRSHVFWLLVSFLIYSCRLSVNMTSIRSRVWYSPVAMAYLRIMLERKDLSRSNRIRTSSRPVLRMTSDGTANSTFEQVLETQQFRNLDP